MGLPADFLVPGGNQVLRGLVFSIITHSKGPYFNEDGLLSLKTAVYRARAIQRNPSHTARPRTKEPEQQQQVYQAEGGGAGLSSQHWWGRQSCDFQAS